MVSKWAVAGFSDVLRYEMEPFGVKVGNIEQYAVRADMKFF